MCGMSLLSIGMFLTPKLLIFSARIFYTGFFVTAYENDSNVLCDKKDYIQILSNFNRCDSGVVVTCNPSKVELGVRFPSVAQLFAFSDLFIFSIFLGNLNHFRLFLFFFVFRYL